MPNHMLPPHAGYLLPVQPAADLPGAYIHPDACQAGLPTGLPCLQAAGRVSGGLFCANRLILEACLDRHHHGRHAPLVDEVLPAQARLGERRSDRCAPLAAAGSRSRGSASSRSAKRQGCAQTLSTRGGSLHTLLPPTGLGTASAVFCAASAASRRSEMSSCSTT